MDFLDILEKSFWAGIAAIGFAVLFNVPVRTLFSIWLLGAIGGLAKFSVLDLGGNIILASLIGASLIGILSISIAHKVHAPPLVFSIPAVIPMVPGAFAYRMMLGLIEIGTHVGDKTGMEEVLVDTAQNGLKVFFILISLAVGVAVPMLITRKESAKRIKMPI